MQIFMLSSFQAYAESTLVPEDKNKSGWRKFAFFFSKKKNYCCGLVTDVKTWLDKKK